MDQDNSTPIVIAASNGNRETVETLLKRGADLCITDSSEKSSLYWAAEENSVEVLRVKFFDHHAFSQIIKSSQVLHSSVRSNSLVL